MNQLLNNGGRVARAMVELGSLVLWAAVTGGTPLALAAVPYLRTHVPDRTTHLMLGLSAGILLGLSFLNLIPESFEAAEGSGLSSRWPSIRPRTFSPLSRSASPRPRVGGARPHSSSRRPSTRPSGF